ncbi:MAG: chromosome segregation protein SMC [Candidatus Aminicenantes bacterium]|nr:chromosome segregation protein SMC [Candidatus Aminicenantes bacterium]
MIIKQLEVQGFKSFPERTKIVFHPGITIIVGPNGTGKSNIVDAILWVLGGRRFKSRSEKIEDVIFHGNENKAPLGLADVNLSLVNDSEKLVINHRLFRSGESEYRLNGKAVRLKDIMDTLWKKAIAEKGYFTIEQGSIERILTSKPIEKRQFLEEAAGTAYYKDKKRQAQNKLENSEQNLTRLEDIIAEVSRAKNSLKRQANAAIKYRKMKEKIRRFTFLLYRKKIDSLEKTKADVASHYDSSLSKEKEIISRIKSEEQKLTAKSREIWDLEKSLKERQDHLFNLRSELNRLEAEIESVEKRIELFEEKKEKAKLNIDELKGELDSLGNELKTAETNLTELKQSFSQKKLELEKAEEANRSAYEKMVSQEKRVESIRKAYLQKISDHSELRNEGVKIEKELELILRQEEKLVSQVGEEKSLLQEKEKTISLSKKAFFQTTSLVKERKKSLEEIEKIQTQLGLSQEKRQEKILELKEKRDRALHQLQALEKIVEKERDTDFSQDIPESLGFLSGMIEADPEHVPLLDVFWKEEGKSLVIPPQELLKQLEGKTIKGNFLLIPPHKINDPPPELSRHPAVIGLLKSRLKVSPKFKEYLPRLQDAVIVQDLRSAIQLWVRFPSYHFLTLSGDLLLSSGLMKAGQKEKGIFVLRQEMKRLKEEVALEEKKIQPLAQELEEKKKEIERLEAKSKQTTLQLTEAEKKVQEMEKGNSADEAEKEKILNHVSVLDRELEILREDKQAIIQRNEDFSLEQEKWNEKEKSLKKELQTQEEQLALAQEKNKQGDKQSYELKASLELLEEKHRNLEHQSQSQIQRKKTAEAKIEALQAEIRDCEEENLRMREMIKNLLEKKKKAEQKKKDRAAESIREEPRFQKLRGEAKKQEEKIQGLKDRHELLKEERVKWEINKAEKERDMVNLEENCWQDLKKTLKEVKAEISEEEKIDPQIEEKIEELEEKLEKLSAVNLMAEEEYLIQKKRHDFLLQEKNDLRESIDTAKKAIKKIDQESKTQFLKALVEINKNFQDVFSLLFKGGVAELRLQDPKTPLESGIEIIAQPPGKKLQNMMLLSGGEKALTSIAFLFALFRYRPTPFCILDEVDAALDDANLARFLELMKKIKNQTQFIIITHNYKTMEVADYIYGTTMAEPSVTNLYSIKMEEKRAE